MVVSGIRSVYQAFVYRGREGQWAWLLHRAAGVGILLFLALHIVDIFLMGFGEGVFNELLFLYKAPPFRVMEVFLVFGVLYHAINGLRVIIIDFWPQSTRIQRMFFRIELALVLMIMVPLAFILLRPIFTGGA